jgi:hypothetical protein
MTLTARLQKRLNRIKALCNKITKKLLRNEKNGYNDRFKRITRHLNHHNFSKKKKIVVRSISGSFLRVVDLNSVPTTYAVFSTVYIRRLCTFI